MLRGIYRDDKRYRETYWSKYPGRYFAGDGAKRDADGYFWLMGRVDDVMKISGHRISTTEVESALVSHPKVAEAAVIGREDPVTTQAIFAFVTLRGANEGSEALSRELREHVVGKIGSIARPWPTPPWWRRSGARPVKRTESSPVIDGAPGKALNTAIGAVLARWRWLGERGNGTDPTQ
jgi:acyl-CoA synthetase (AMP-forming)/AMP-acid ligase II